MPIFEYVCRECDHHFETIVLGSQRPQCPTSSSQNLPWAASVQADHCPPPAAAARVVTRAVPVHAR